MKHIDMYALGDKYRMKELSSLALAKFAQAFSGDWSSGCFAKIAKAVYDRPAREQELRDVFVRGVASVWDRLRGDEEVYEYLGTDAELMKRMLNAFQVDAVTERREMANSLYRSTT